MTKPNETINNPVATEDTSIVEGITENVSDFDKLMSDEISSNPETEKPDKGGKPEETADDEFDIKPKAKKPEKPEEDSEEKSTAKPEEEVGEKKPSDPSKRMIGEFELTDEEWIEAAFDRQNRSVWQKNLTQKSQIAAKVLPKLTEDDLQFLLPYAMGQKELPDNLKDAVLQSTGLPEKFIINQEDGTEIEIFTKDIPKNILGILGKAAMAQIYPEIDKIKEDHTKLLEENNKIKRVQMTSQQRIIEGELKDLMKEESDIAFDGGIRKGESIINKLAMIHQVGPDHPEYKTAQRIMMILQYAQTNGMRVKDAYYDFFGKAKAEKDAKKQIIENQKNDTSRETGKKPSKDEDFETQMIKEVSGGDSSILDNLGL
jgi:hypothetical protein